MKKAIPYWGSSIERLTGLDLLNSYLILNNTRIKLLGKNPIKKP